MEQAGMNVSFDGGSDIAGMTTNERLSHFNLLNQFDSAARARNRSGMTAILARAMVDNPEWVADTILEAPEKYGYGS